MSVLSCSVLEQTDILFEMQIPSVIKTDKRQEHLK